MEILAIIIVIFFAIGIHEYAHCKAADMAGDPTPRMYGRVTLDLTKHFEPLGTIMIILTSISGYGIGWGKPAPVNPSMMRNPRWDHFVSVAAGPLSNLIQAGIWAIILRVGMMVGPEVAPSNFLFILPFYGVMINLSLFFFNLLPLPPLDGHWLLGLLLPEKPRIQWFQFCRSVGSGLFLIVVIGSQVAGNAFGYDPLGELIGKPLYTTAKFLLGI